MIQYIGIAFMIAGLFMVFCPGTDSIKDRAKYGLIGLVGMALVLGLLVLIADIGMRFGGAR